MDHTCLQEPALKQQLTALWNESLVKNRNLNTNRDLAYNSVPKATMHEMEANLEE